MYFKAKRIYHVFEDNQTSMSEKNIVSLDFLSLLAESVFNKISVVEIYYSYCQKSRWPVRIRIQVLHYTAIPHDVHSTNLTSNVVFLTFLELCDKAVSKVY